MTKFLIVLLLVRYIHALTLGLCSTSNSGSGYDAVTDEYMSNGECRNQCLENGYTYAILQSYSCWCSNELPDSSTDSDNCDTKCPGYGEEMCASTGYFGYLNVQNPDLTLSVSSASSSTQQATLSDPITSTSSSSSSSSSKTTTKLKSSSTEAASSSLSSSADADTTSSSATSDEVSTVSTVSSTEIGSSITGSSIGPTTIYSVTTVSGNRTIMIQTEYVTAEPTSSSESIQSASATATEEADSSSKSFFDSSGKVAGTFTAVGVVVLGLLAGLLYCCCCMRKTDDGNEDAYTDEENQLSSDESMSKTPVMKSGAVSLKRDNSAKSMFSLLNKESVGGLTRNLSKKRLNSPKDQQMEFTDIQMFHITEFESNRQDSRLEPLFMNENLSTQTLGDNIDYSRKLKVANPSPPES